MQSITSALSNPIIKPFTTLESLQNDAQQVLSTFTNNHSNNQYILLLNTSPSILDLLTNDKTALSGISFRLTYEQSTTLLKLTPSYTHHAITARLSTTIDRLCIVAGVPEDDLEWALNTTFTAGDRGKQADNCLLTRCRQGLAGQCPKWPVLVVEVGNGESLGRLREDVKWWVGMSGGDVRVVLVVIVEEGDRRVEVERWEGEGEKAWMVQRVVVTPLKVDGDVPFALDLKTLFGIPGNVVLDEQRLLYLAKNLWWI